MVLSVVTFYNVWRGTKSTKAYTIAFLFFMSQLVNFPVIADIGWIPGLNYNSNRLLLIDRMSELVISFNMICFWNGMWLFTYESLAATVFNESWRKFLPWFGWCFPLLTLAMVIT